MGEKPEHGTAPYLRERPNVSAVLEYVVEYDDTGRGVYVP